MKKLIIALALILALLLGGCGNMVTMTTQYPTYAGDIRSISLVIRNIGNEGVYFGEDWQLEEKINGRWCVLGHEEDFFHFLNFPRSEMLSPGHVVSFTIPIGQITDHFHQGTYRIVKEIGTAGGRRTAAAEFTIGQSSISAQSPHGLVPLEQLPADVDQENDSEAVTAFFDQLAIGLPAQLRTVHDDNAGNTIVTDLIASANHSLNDVMDRPLIHYRQRKNGEITESFFSHIITDGTQIALSGAPVWLEEENQRILPEMLNGEADWPDKAKHIDQLRKNAGSSANRLIFWAPNGRYSVKIPLDEQNKPGKTAYCVGGDIPSSGNLGKTLAGYSPHITGILEADWSADSQTVILICGASDGGCPWYFTYDVQKGRVTEIHHEPK